jgi:serine/threonine protein kinase
MIPRREWESLRALFEAALQRPAAERSAFLRDQSHGDEATCREVESLLAAHEQAEDFLKESAADPASENVLPIDTPRLAAGSRLGAFEILEPLGIGGMGEVYRARDTRLDRCVAIKVLSAELEIAPRGRQRFEREARAISKLSHPHICTVHDVGTAQVDRSEVSFLVLELLEGETLAAQLARGPLPIPIALTYATDVADALATAHAHGIVHRDLKPSNVMVTRSGVKLLDFGLAQLRMPDGAAAELPATASHTPLTAAGMVFGTLPYMSPEQVEGRRVDSRSDIFSFGSLLYEMLTAQRAFAGDSERSAAVRILSEDPKPLDELAPLVPADLAKIVSRCLRKDPARRYQHIADVKVALDDVRDESAAGSHAQTARPTSRWRWAWLLLVLPVVLAGGLLRLAHRTARQFSDSAACRADDARGGRGWSPDGQMIAFDSSLGGQFDVYVVPAVGGSVRRMTSEPSADNVPSFSRDGKSLYFSSNRSGVFEIWKIPSPDGRTILFTRMDNPSSDLMMIENFR